MKRLTLGVLSLTLISGCTDSATKVESAAGRPPTTEAMTDTQQPAEPDISSETDSVTADSVSSVNAEQLLATTLASAQADDKRVFVHLGAPW